MEYFIKKSNKETGPIDQGTLLDWARKGQISEETMIKNNLMTSWKPAKDLTLLKSIFKEQREAKGQSLGSRISDNLGSHRKAQGINNNIVTLDSVKSASMQYRFGAALIDAVITYLVYLAFAYPYFYFQHNYDMLLGGKVPDEVLKDVPYFILLSIFIEQLYKTLTVGGWAQTIGQKFFGIMQIKHNTLGEPVLMGRSYFFNTFFIIFLPINILFIFIFRRGLHEMLSGTSVVNVRLG